MRSQDFANTLNTLDPFSNAASVYDEYAIVQKEAATLLHELTLHHIQHCEMPRAILDVGCGTGALTKLMRKAFPGARLWAVDLAPGMLDAITQADWIDSLTFPILGDGQQLHTLELSAEMPQLLVSNMCAQWFEDIEDAITQWVNHADYLSFSVMLDGSLTEWKQAHEQHALPCGLRPLPTPLQIESTLVGLKESGAIKRFDIQYKQLIERHPSGYSFAKRLKAIGANQPKEGHHPSYLRKVLKTLSQGCNANYELGFYWVEQA